MQYFRFAFTAVALFSIANSSPLLYEAATSKQAQGLDPIPAKFGSHDNKLDAITRPVLSSHNPVKVTKPAGSSYNDLDTAYSLYRSSLQNLAKQLQGPSSISRTSNNDDARIAYQTAQSTVDAFRTAAKPTPTVCAAIRLIPAEDKETAVKYVAFVQHTSQQAYEHSIAGDGQSAYWDFCLIDDYMAAVSRYIEKGQNVYNGRSIGTY